MPARTEDDVPVYVISIAAQLSGLHPQTLRQYDRLGLVSPGRAVGRGRRYSARDIATLRQVQQLTAEGVNLAGVKRILQLEAAVARLHRRLAELEEPEGPGREPRGERSGGMAVVATTPGEPGPGAAGRPAGTGPEHRAPVDADRVYLPVPVAVRSSTAVVRWRPGRVS